MGLYDNWCRIRGHAPSCKCAYQNTDPRNNSESLKAEEERLKQAGRKGERA